MAAPDSVVSRRPDGTQLEVLRATGAEDEEVGAGGGGGREHHGPGSREQGERGGHPRSPEQLQKEEGNWPREPSDRQCLWAARCVLSAVQQGPHPT